jgi:hypothetical protein
MNSANEGILSIVALSIDLRRALRLVETAGDGSAELYVWSRRPVMVQLLDWGWMKNMMPMQQMANVLLSLGKIEEGLSSSARSLDDSNLERNDWRAAMRRCSGGCRPAFRE